MGEWARCTRNAAAHLQQITPIASVSTAPVRSSATEAVVKFPSLSLSAHGLH